MENIKYTNDGKKVKVIGNLNQTTKIVQEIFVTDAGDEIPSGENFTVTSLHDEPVKSWHEKEVIRMTEKYEVTKERLQKEIDQLQKRYQESRKKVNAWCKNLKTPESFQEHFQEIIKILSFQYKFIVSNRYGKYTINDFDEELVRNDERFDDGLRLLTIYGRNKGGLNFRLNEYTDGSGTKTEVFFFETKEEAINFIKNKVLKNVDEKGKVSETEINNSEKYGFELPKDKVLEFYEEKLKNRKDHVERKKKEFEKEAEELKKIKEMTKKLK